MKTHLVTQGTAEWHDLRLGIPTASEFHKIVTPGGKLSAQARKYALRLVTETLLRRPLESLEGLSWLDRGKELEPEAARLYEFHHDCTLEAVGFVTTDDGRIGCSPDRLIMGQPGAVEIKCPAPHTHVGYLIDGPGDDYRPQVQGQLLVAELEYVDFLSYSPEMPPVVLRFTRDEPYLQLLRMALSNFLELRDELLGQVRAAGYFEERAKILMPQDAEYGGMLDG